MAHWIFIEEGAYLVESAFILTPAYSAVTLDDAVIEVFLDSNGERRVRGHGMATNVLIVELLEDHDELDLLLDLGDQFHYLMKTPSIMAGKVFSPDVRSLIRFIAQGPLDKMSNSEYLQVRSRMSLIDRQGG
jgi:hypothetical protein